MSKFAKLYTSFENEAPQEAVAETTVENVIDAQEQTQEIIKNQAEVKEIEKAIDTGLQEVENLEIMANQLENSIPEGGAEPVSAQIAEIAIESIYHRLGIKTKVISSLEDFNDSRSRVKATELAIENIRNTQSRINLAIENLVAKLIFKIIELVQNNKKKLEGIRDKLSAIINQIDESKSIELDAILYPAIVSNNDNDIKKIIATLKYVKNTNITVNYGDKLQKNVLNLVEKAFKTAKSEEQGQKFIEDINNGLHKFITDLGYKKLDNKIDSYYNPNLVTGTVATIVKFTKDDILIEIDGDFRPGSVEGKLVTISGKDIKLACKLALEVTNIYVDYFDNVNNKYLDIRKKFDELVIHDDNKNLKGIGKTLQAILKFIPVFDKEFLKLIIRITAGAYKLGWLINKQ